MNRHDAQNAKTRDVLPIPPPWCAWRFGGCMSEMKGRSVLIIGLGRSGIGLARYLANQGRQVELHDDNPTRFESQEVRGLVHQGARLWDGATDDLELALVSPGVPESAPVVQRLRQHAVQIMDEVEFGYEIVGRKIIAVTGTNGKSTTTVLVGEMFRADGQAVFYGGNLAPGRPFSAALLEPPRDWYVLEVSSFQLERCQRFAPRVGVLLNVTPDHLNRHQNLERYLELKLRLFRNQGKGDFAVLNQDDPQLRRQELRRPGANGPEVLWFSLEDPRADATLHAGWLEFRGARIVRREEVRLIGKHNLANALAAIAVARTMGVGIESIGRVLRSFAGLEHRLELVREVNGVRYVNNSMCTNPAAALAALNAFEAPIILITGGREKDLPHDEYVRAIARQAKAAILVGENRERLHAELKHLGYQARMAASLREAVRLTQAISRPGDVVLFSPGFASFDQYSDFMERGKAFKDVIRENFA